MKIIEKIQLQSIVITFKLVAQYTGWLQAEYVSADPLIVCTLLHSIHFYETEAANLLFFTAVQLQGLQ